MFAYTHRHLQSPQIWVPFFVVVAILLWVVHHLDSLGSLDEMAYMPEHFPDLLAFEYHTQNTSKLHWSGAVVENASLLFFHLPFVGYASSFVSSPVQKDTYAMKKNVGEKKRQSRC